MDLEALNLMLSRFGARQKLGEKEEKTSGEGDEGMMKSSFYSIREFKLK